MSISVTSIPVLLLSEIIPEVIGSVKYTKYAEESKQKFSQLDFETVIIDKNTLLKTLIEHGAKNVVEKHNHIFCDCENYYLEFYKHDELKPYKLTISCKEQEGLKTFLNNLSSEYTTNAQEVSYNKIKTRLEEQNLEIEEEEIFEDNTIVLTVNLE